MSLHVNDGGTWKEVQNLSVYDGGSWKDVAQAWVRDGDCLLYTSPSPRDQA